MSSVTGTTGTQLGPPSTSTTGVLGGGSASASTPANPLGENAFLTLMMTQLQDQDPLNPSDPTQYLSELAQMTSVEQETQTAQSVAESTQAQAASSAVSLLGHTITYIDSNGNQQTGVVQAVSFSSTNGTTGPTLTVNGVGGIEPSSISEVQ